MRRIPAVARGETRSRAGMPAAVTASAAGSRTMARRSQSWAGELGTTRTSVANAPGKAARRRNPHAATPARAAETARAASRMSGAGRSRRTRLARSTQRRGETIPPRENPKAPSPPAASPMVRNGRRRSSTPKRSQANSPAARTAGRSRSTALRSHGARAGHEPDVRGDQRQRYDARRRRARAPLPAKRRGARPRRPHPDQQVGEDQRARQGIALDVSEVELAHSEGEQEQCGRDPAPRAGGDLPGEQPEERRGREAADHRERG